MYALNKKIKKKIKKKQGRISWKNNEKLKKIEIL